MFERSIEVVEWIIYYHSNKHYQVAGRVLANSREMALQNASNLDRVSSKLGTAYSVGAVPEDEFLPFINATGLLPVTAGQEKDTRDLIYA